MITCRQIQYPRCSEESSGYSIQTIVNTTLDGKPIEALFPKSVKRSGYKACTTEQIQMMIEKSSDIRNKALIHFQASTGGRVGGS